MKKRIQYFKLSHAVYHFREKLINIYKLKQINNSQIYEPVVVFGLYNKSDYDFILRHKGKILLVWCGSDMKELSTSRYNIIRKINSIEHISIGGFIKNRMNKFKMKYKEIPISFSDKNIHSKPIGDKIYFYGLGDKYGEQHVSDIEKRTGLKVIKTTCNTYSHNELLNIYEQCFIGLRLTKFDGLPNTVLQLGLMGRKSIYNGKLPHTIEWNTIDDICETLIMEYKNRNLVNCDKISNDYKKFLDIGDDWLYYELQV